MKPSLKLSQKYPQYYKGEISTPLQHLLSGIKKECEKIKKSIRLATLQYANCMPAICEWLTDLLHSLFRV